MLILLPVLILIAVALTLILLRFLRPGFKYPWLVAAGGASLTLISVFFWKIQFPQSMILPAWKLALAFPFRPGWVADGISWPFSLALTALCTAVLWTSVVRNENEPLTWAWVLLLTALGILATAAANPLTLILVWSAIDLAEFIAMLGSTEGDGPTEGVVLAFAVRLAGILLVLWAVLTSQPAGAAFNFETVPASVGLYLILAAGLRLGVLPLHLPYRQEHTFRRGFGTHLRLVSVLASLTLLARLPGRALDTPLLPALALLACLAACYAGWMWLRSSDEVIGRPFFVLGVASLAVLSCLRASQPGVVGWGVAMVLGGGALFLFSARRRRVIWIPLLGLLSLSTLPYSISASAWISGNANSWLFLVPALPAQGLLMAGFLRHSLHPGETSLESQEKWARIIYPAGLLLLAAISILLGFWGWEGAGLLGPWPAALAAALLTAGITILAVRLLPRLPAGAANPWGRILRPGWLASGGKAVLGWLQGLTNLMVSSLEGEGGLLWSLLLLVLILSLLATGVLKP